MKTAHLLRSIGGGLDDPLRSLPEDCAGEARARSGGFSLASHMNRFDLPGDGGVSRPQRWVLIGLSTGRVGVEAVADRCSGDPGGDVEGATVGFEQDRAVAVGAVDVGAGGGEAGEDAAVGVAG